MLKKEFLTADQISALQEKELASDKKQKRTAEQIEAIYANGTNILVSASAGSGKTFVMVERIIDQILRGVSVNQLFISTFTVKAAGELKERLEKKIRQAQDNTADPEVKQFLTQQLVDLQTADIGTMDAFTQKLVNQYGYTLGISPNFRILQDESEQMLIKNEVFADLFADYMKRPQTDMFKQLVKNFAGSRKDNIPFKQIVYSIYNFSQATDSPERWLRENFLKGAKTFTDFSALPEQEIKDLLTGMEQTAKSLRDLTELEDYKQVTKKGEKTATYKKHLVLIEKLDEWSSNFSSLYGRQGLGRLAQDLVGLLPAGSDVTVAGVKYPVFKGLHGRLAGFKHLETILKYQAQSLPLLEILQEFILDFSEQYLQAKKEENAFEFSDIAHFAIDILEKNDTIRQLYQLKYHEIMVDEYQDNSHTQEKMLELLSNGHNRFMVGDIKQSIYRFRQADPEIFNQKFKTYQAHPEEGKLILLKENFRSQSEVLETTNRIFSHLMDENVGEIRYDDTHQLVAGSAGQKEGHPENETELLLYDTDSGQDDLAGEEADTISPGEVKLVAKEIIRLHNDEKVKFEEMTLLVSSRTRNDNILKTFENYGIPLVADDGEQNYLKSLEVMVMLDTLRALDNPLNDYALVALLRSPMFSFDEDDLARLSLQESEESSKQNLYEKMQNVSNHQGRHGELVTEALRVKLDSFFETFLAWRAFAKLHSLHDLIWKIYNDRFYYDYVGSLPKAAQRQANLYALALRANQFEQTGFKGLARFIGMIDKVLENEKDLAAVEVALPKNAVSLMTIHKSKGLEFKYVFVLNLDKRFSAVDINSSVILSRQNGIGIKYLADMKEELGEQKLPSLKVSMDTLPYQINKRELRLATLSEQMRLLYVAMTRAETKLYLVGKGSQEKLTDKYDGKSENHRLPVASRESFMTFQDWFLAIQEAYKTENLHFKSRYVTDQDLTEEKIGTIETQSRFAPDNLKDNRQSEDIAQALDMLEAVEKINQKYQAAIELPTLRTPSQLKRPKVSDGEGEQLALIGSQEKKATADTISFALPDFGKSTSVSPTDLGSALHELMQKIDLSRPISRSHLAETLTSLPQEAAVKKQIDLHKVQQFFQTPLGQEILAHKDKVHREAPFAMLKKDEASGEDFVIRGIIDGYILYEDRIVLFDYKTDRYQNHTQLRERYQEQMALYQEALSQAYGIRQVDCYLILFGGQDLEVIHL
ncbi:helicase-exonuclease AddAB subunit AddA [Streptococcus ferus]|uniref:helicase-exonuclease AddAB subunit AddA n=1 Tax=Streptococcus ferus TaxID=1345 RepID=UPI0035A164DB